MTESEWLASNDAKAMVDALAGARQTDPVPPHLVDYKVSDRKLRLFAQVISYPIIAEPTGEGYPDLPAAYLSGFLQGPDRLQADLLRDIVGNPFRSIATLRIECDSCCGRGKFAEGFGPDLECPDCDGVGSIPGPFLFPDVVSVAETIYEDRSFDELPILADALEEAGCDNEDILNHLRGDCVPGMGPCDAHPHNGMHVRGCWALDLILGLD